MARACVIVLDAVGAGELPDAADYGDEGSNTLANVAKAVGGLDLPNLEALGLGNVEELEGCPPQPYAPAVAGRLLEPARTDFEGVHRMLLKMIEDYNERDLMDNRRYPWMEGEPLSYLIEENAILHERDHAADIRAWREREGL